MLPEIEIKIELVPVVKLDPKTELYSAHFEQFPRARAEGATFEEAVLGLTEIFAIMFKENEKEIMGKILEMYNPEASQRHFQQVKDVRVNPGLRAFA